MAETWGPKGFIGDKVCAGCNDDIWPGEVSYAGADGTVLCVICEGKAARAVSAVAERIRGAARETTPGGTP